MERKFTYGRGTASAHEIAVNTSFNDNPYSIELDRLDPFEISTDDPFMISVLDTKKSLFDEAKLVRRILNRDTFIGERSKSPTKSKTSKRTVKNNATNDDDEEGEVDGVIVVKENEPQQDDDVEETEKKGEKAPDDSDSDNADEEVEEDDDVDDNDYMENHFDNGEDYIDE